MFLKIKVIVIFLSSILSIFISSMASSYVDRRKEKVDKKMLEKLNTTIFILILIIGLTAGTIIYEWEN